MAKRLSGTSEDVAMLAEAGLDSVTRVLKLEPGRTSALSQSSDIFPLHLTLSDGRRLDIFVKRYRYRSRAARLTGIFRGSMFGRLRSAFEYGFLTEMRRRGLPAVKPLAYAAKRSLGFVKAGILITEAAPNAVQLDTWAGAHIVPGDLAQALGREVRRMHDAGVRHGGLFLRNILLDAESAGDWRLFFVDPDRSGRLETGPLAREQAMQDLSDLTASALVVCRATNRMRFAHAYFGVKKLGEDHKSLLGSLFERAEKKVPQEEHRIAVGGMIHWLQARIEGDHGTARAVFGGVEHLAAVANGASIPTDWVLTRRATVVLIVDESSTTKRFQLSFDEGQVRTGRTTDEGGDLTIRADEETWRALLNAEPQAFGLLRKGRMTMVGETRHLTLLARLIDEIVASGRAS